MEKRLSTEEILLIFLQERAREYAQEELRWEVKKVEGGYLFGNLGWRDSDRVKQIRTKYPLGFVHTSGVIFQIEWEGKKKRFTVIKNRYEEIVSSADSFFVFLEKWYKEDKLSDELKTFYQKERITKLFY